MKNIAPVAAVLAALLPLQALRATTVVDFEDLTLAPDSFYNGSDFAGGFSSRGVEFDNDFDDSFGFDLWTGFAYSNVNDPTTPGPGNQYAVAGGTGFGGSGIYAVATHKLSGTQADIVTFPSPTRVDGFYANNSTYAALSMRDGDGFAKKFGGASGTDPDWLLLMIRGVDTVGDPAGSIDFYLADFRAEESSEDYILTDWTWVDTSSLGPDVSSLHFDMSSSDSGAFGMNTPAYFAMDNLVVPEPETFGLFVIAAALGACRNRRRRDSMRR